MDAWKWWAIGIALVNVVFALALCRAAGRADRRLGLK